MAHDVVVLGATIAGLTLARRLARRGFDVVVIDPNAEGRSAAVGHGVAAIGHASTVATMDHAYGPDVVQEHLVRNLAGIAAIRKLHPEATEVPLYDSSLPGGSSRETREVARRFREAGGEAEVLKGPGGTLVRTTALILDPVAYAATLRAAAVKAGVQVVHAITVTHLTRNEGTTRVYFRSNLAWAREPGMISGHAVVDTLGVSPWGRAARIGPAQWVPVINCRVARPAAEVTLRESAAAWMIRPTTDDGILVLGRKTTLSGIDGAIEALSAWVGEELGATDIVPGRLAIDPSDHGRPVVGASAIPGGFYARGNGRGELMNGTASAHYLAGLIADPRSSGTALPPTSQLRAFGMRRLRRR